MFYISGYVFKILQIEAPSELTEPEIRLALDTKEDYILLCLVFDSLYKENEFFATSDIINFFKSKPWIKDINKGVFQKNIFDTLEQELEESMKILDLQDLKRAKDFIKDDANAIYLMTTANYSFDKFIEIGKEVKKNIPSDIPLVANIGDFGVKEAERLIDAGFYGVYHVRRLREGKDTKIDPQKRLATMKAIKNSGLVLLHCVEPVGPEHTPEEIVELMFEGKEYKAAFSGAMRRIPVPGTPLAKLGIISEIELAKIVAISRLVMGSSVKGHCTHEPNMTSLLAGANLFFPETGPNPRDRKEETSEGRGYTVKMCKNMFKEAGLFPLQGSSIVFDT